MKTFEEIKALYPYQFSGEHIGLSIANGWLPEFARLCKDINDLLGENKRNFHWFQLKEKFGSARYYWNMDNVKAPQFVDLITSDGVVRYTNKPKAKTHDKVLVEKLNTLISEASDRTLAKCIVCGENGKHDNFDCYTLVLCGEHRRARHAGEELDIWPSSADDQ
jgi:hypothetical protein